MGVYFDISYKLYIFGFIIPDYLQCILGAILRSIGMEKKAMGVYIVGFYIFGCSALYLAVYVFEY